MKSVIYKMAKKAKASDYLGVPWAEPHSIERVDAAYLANEARLKELMQECARSLLWELIFEDACFDEREI